MNIVFTFLKTLKKFHNLSILFSYLSTCSTSSQKNLNINSIVSKFYKFNLNLNEEFSRAIPSV